MNATSDLVAITQWNGLIGHSSPPHKPLVRRKPTKSSSIYIYIPIHMQTGRTSIKKPCIQGVLEGSMWGSFNNRYLKRVCNGISWVIENAEKRGARQRSAKGTQ